MAQLFSKGIGGHERTIRGKTDTWLTPPRIIRALGDFDLDPCCPPDMPWQTAKVMICEPADGLAANWFGRVWLNPPYGPELERWMRAMAAHDQGIAMIFARTETEAFHRHIWNRADAMLFMRGRVKFYRHDGHPGNTNAGAPTVLIAYSPGDAIKLENSGIDGKFLRLR